MLTGNNTLHVVWFDLWFPGAKTYGRSVVSHDGGLSWSMPIQINPPEMFGLDGLSVAAGVDPRTGDSQLVASYVLA